MKRRIRLKRQAILRALALYYDKNREEKIASSRAMKVKNAKSAIKRARQQYYAKHRAQYCADMRRRYDLAQPKSYVQVGKKVLSSKKIISLLKKLFQQKNESIAKEMSSCYV